MRRLVARAAVAVAALTPWLWFTTLAFIVRPMAAGPISEVYALIGPARVLQGLVYAGVSFVVLAAFLVVASRRVAVTGTWLFRPLSIGRVAKWVAVAALVGYVLTVVPSAALVADVGDEIPREGYGVEWATVPWLVVLGLSALAAPILVLIDLIGAFASGRPRDSRHGDT